MRGDSPLFVILGANEGSDVDQPPHYFGGYGEGSASLRRPLLGSREYGFVTADLFPVAAEVTRLGIMSAVALHHLPRLDPEYYRGHAAVFWTYTVANRGTGWLNERFHAGFRELMLHAAVREQLLCPIYTLMPDHAHFIWLGIHRCSDQRRASTFLRSQLEPLLRSHTWQHQPHDHVLRHREKTGDAFTALCHYITENPVRAGLVARSDQWDYTHCVVTGYPDLHPSAGDFWEKFWRVHAVDVERGALGKIEGLR